MSHENNGVRALPPETFETGERFRTPFLVCEDLTNYLGGVQTVHKQSIGKQFGKTGKQFGKLAFVWQTVHKQFGIRLAKTEIFAKC